MVRRFTDAFLMHIRKYREWYIKATNILATLSVFILEKTVIISSIMTIGSGGSVMITPAILLALLTNPHVMIPAITAGVVIIALKTARSIPLAIKESLDLRLPTTVQERAVYIRKVRGIFHSKAGVDIDKLGVATLSEDETGKTARELGYTKEHIAEIVHTVTDAIDAIKRCDFIPKRLEELSQSVEATTSNGRAALIFITGVITKTMHLAVSDTMKATQQMHKLDTALNRVSKKQ